MSVSTSKGKFTPRSCWLWCIDVWECRGRNIIRACLVIDILWKCSVYVTLTVHYICVSLCLVSICETRSVSITRGECYHRILRLGYEGLTSQLQNWWNGYTHVCMYFGWLVKCHCGFLTVCLVGLSCVSKSKFKATYIHSYKLTYSADLVKEVRIVRSGVLLKEVWYRMPKSLVTDLYILRC